MLTLSYKNDKGVRITYKAIVKKGIFLFKGPLNSPVEADLLSDRRPKSDDDSQYAQLFLFPGAMMIQINGGFDRAKVTGSPMYDDWQVLQKQTEQVIKIKDSLYTQMFKVERVGNTPKNHTAHVLIVDKIDRCNAQEDQIEYKFIQTHPSSYLSPYLLYNYFEGRALSLDSANRFYNAFTPLVKNSIAGRCVGRVISHRNASAAGSYAPDFTKTDIKGKKLNLRSFRGKNYVLLYFWGSWSFYEGKDTTPIQLKQWYKKYHAKGLEVIGISRDLLKRDWKKAIVDDGMGMFHQIFSPYGNLFDVYDVDSTPPVFLFLIDKNGKILGRYLGEHVSWEKGSDNEGSLADLDYKLVKTLGN